MFRLALTTALDPLANPVGITEGCQLAKGVEQYDGEWLVVNLGLHHEAASGLVEVTGLAELDVPGFVFQQAVGVIVPEFTAALVWPDAGRAGGGGITNDSVEEDEWQETQNKLQTMLQVLQPML